MQILSVGPTTFSYSVSGEQLLIVKVLKLEMATRESRETRGSRVLDKPYFQQFLEKTSEIKYIYSKLAWDLIPRNTK